MVLCNKSQIRNAGLSAIKQVQKFALICGDVVCFGHLGTFSEGWLIRFYFCVDPLVADVYLKPFRTLPDGSDLERVLFEPFLSNFLPPQRAPPCPSQELIPVRLEITSMLFSAGNDVLTDEQR